MICIIWSMLVKEKAVRPSIIVPLTVQKGHGSIKVHSQIVLQIVLRYILELLIIKEKITSFTTMESYQQEGVIVDPLQLITCTIMKMVPLRKWFKPIKGWMPLRTN